MLIAAAPVAGLEGNSRTPDRRRERACVTSAIRAALVWRLALRRRPASGNLFSMNLWGYDRGESGDGDGTPRELREVSVAADDPAELRRVAQFLAEAANIVESRRDLDPGTYGSLASDWHLHYRDWADSWADESGDLIVIRPRS